MLAQSLVLHGRALDVARAVTRDEAGKLKEEGEKRREKADKRNLYLLREGGALHHIVRKPILTLGSKSSYRIHLQPIRLRQPRSKGVQVHSMPGGHY